MNPPPPEALQPGSILIVRLSAIGDILFATPLITALRRTYPRARLAWLVQSEYRDLLAAHPDLDLVIPCPLRSWRTRWREGRRRQVLREVADLRARLRRERFDLALDLQGLLKSGLLTWLSGARRRIGLGSREGSGLLMTRVLRPLPDSPRISSEYLFLAQRLGLDAGEFGMALHPRARDTATADALIDQHGLGGGFVAACPFTTRAQKHWFAERWIELARRVHSELGLPLALLGAPGDAAAGGDIAAAAGDAAVSLAGGTSLLEAAALIARARAVVGVDTGLSHMGIALRRPTLLLFGATCPYRDTTRADARVLYHARACSPCRRRPTCDGRFDCMRDIGVDEVLRALCELPGMRPGVRP
jgi:heptosyltransferase-1